MFHNTPICFTVRMTKINAARHFERRQFPVATVFQGNIIKNLRRKRWTQLLPVCSWLDKDFRGPWIERRLIASLKSRPQLISSGGVELERESTARNQERSIN